MNLTHKKICYELNTVDAVEKLIKSSFPPNEQDPDGKASGFGSKTDGEFLGIL